MSGQSRRPRGRTRLEVHEEVASELRHLIGATARRVGARTRLERVRCDLDDWVQVEYDYAELDMERFSKMYYGKHGTTLGRTPLASEAARVTASIHHVRRLLTDHYPDSTPLRTL